MTVSVAVFAVMVVPVLLLSGFGTIAEDRFGERHEDIFPGAHPDEEHDGEGDVDIGEGESRPRDHDADERCDAAADVRYDVEFLPRVGDVAVLVGGILVYHELPGVDPDREDRHGRGSEYVELGRIVQPFERLHPDTPRDDRDEDGADHSADLTDPAFIVREPCAVRDEGGEDVLGAVEERVEGVREERHAPGEDASDGFDQKHEEREFGEFDISRALFFAGADAGFLMQACGNMSVGHGKSPLVRVVKKLVTEVCWETVETSRFLPSSGFFDTVILFWATAPGIYEGL